MAKKLRWVPNQVKIANLLANKKSVEEVVALTGAGKSTVQKVQTGLNQGQKPPSLKEVAAELTPTPKGNDKKPTGIVRFVASRIDCEYTPIMIIARQAAVEEWNWDPNMRFEDFVDTIFYHFFKDRGITLQGYIVDEKVEAK